MVVQEAEVLCALAFGLLKLAGGSLCFQALPGTEVAAVQQHSMCQTAPYISHVVDVETLARFVNALLVPQRPSTGSRGAHRRASQAAAAACLVAGLACAGWGWGRENGIAETSQKAGAGAGYPAAVKTPWYQ